MTTLRLDLPSSCHAASMLLCAAAQPATDSSGAPATWLLQAAPETAGTCKFTIPAEASGSLTAVVFMHQSSWLARQTARDTNQHYCVLDKRQPLPGFSIDPAASSSSVSEAWLCISEDTVCSSTIELGSQACRYGACTAQQLPSYSPIPPFRITLAGAASGSKPLYSLRIGKPLQVPKCWLGLAQDRLLIGKFRTDTGATTAVQTLADKLQLQQLDSILQSGVQLLEGIVPIGVSARLLQALAHSTADSLSDDNVLPLWRYFTANWLAINCPSVTVGSCDAVQQQAFDEAVLRETQAAAAADDRSVQRSVAALYCRLLLSACACYHFAGDMICGEQRWLQTCDWLSVLLAHDGFGCTDGDCEDHSFLCGRLHISLAKWWRRTHDREQQPAELRALYSLLRCMQPENTQWRLVQVTGLLNGRWLSGGANDTDEQQQARAVRPVAHRWSMFVHPRHGSLCCDGASLAQPRAASGSDRAELSVAWLAMRRAVSMLSAVGALLGSVRLPSMRPTTSSVAPLYLVASAVDSNPGLPDEPLRVCRVIEEQWSALPVGARCATLWQDATPLLAADTRATATKQYEKMVCETVLPPLLPAMQHVLPDVCREGPLPAAACWLAVQALAPTTGDPPSHSTDSLAAEMRNPSDTDSHLLAIPILLQQQPIEELPTFYAAICELLRNDNTLAAASLRLTSAFVIPYCEVRVGELPAVALFCARFGKLAGAATT